jgi:hypothetical protein
MALHRPPAVPLVLCTALTVGATTVAAANEAKNGGELITLSPAEAKRYLDLVAPVATSVLSVNPKVKDDYEALLAAAQKYRQ